jgi:hypothetical protein
MTFTEAHEQFTNVTTFLRQTGLLPDSYSKVINSVSAKLAMAATVEQNQFDPQAPRPVKA